MACPNCRMLLAHTAVSACSLASDNDGNRIAISTAMIAMTTSSSINVKPRPLVLLIGTPPLRWDIPQPQRIKDLVQRMASPVDGHGPFVRLLRSSDIPFPLQHLAKRGLSVKCQLPHPSQLGPSAPRKSYMAGSYRR